ncbi:MAG TPA: hypothetical protein VNG51_04155 [Ktedonobacteraceae bacterium]|nr:hypothetical protein [Ktedonobacteraceae bacterium]
MAKSTRTIYREKALQHYVQSWEKVTLPRFVAPSVFTFLWLLLVLLLAATLLAWLGQVPVYTTGSGFVLSQASLVSDSSDAATVVVFLPATSALNVKVGLPMQVQIGATGPQLNTTVTTVETTVLSPSVIRQRYSLNGSLANIVTQPSIVLTAKLGSALSAKTYAGSLVSVQVQVGTQRVLSLFNQLIGA